jgi:myo-inositol 2-dehydrogenase / D-chiro-inositol 1-dehydrogenase
MTRPAPVSVGLVGCGEVARRFHLPALARLPEAVVTAVADPDPAALSAAAERFAIPKRYEDPAALLADGSIDAVAICAPTACHAPLALEALRRGKHVLLEKPVALSLDEADALLAAARSSGRRVLVGFNMRWHRLVREARALLRRGALGRVRSVRSTFTTPLLLRDDVPAWRLDRRSGGGALFDLAPHHFDLWRFLLGEEVREVRAAADARSAAVSASTESGVLLSASFSEAAPDANEVEIVGDDGSLRVSCYRAGGLAARGRTLGWLSRLPAALAASFRGGDYPDSYRAEWRHFVDCVRGGAEPACGLEDGRRSLAVALAALRSADEGGPVSV